MSDVPNPDGSSPRKTKFGAPPPMVIDPSKRYTAVMETSMGTLTIALDAAAAPKTVNNFVFLAGGTTTTGSSSIASSRASSAKAAIPRARGAGGPGYRFEDELPKAGRYEIGSLAMANAGPNTNGSQFFLISGNDGARLPPQYSLFGKVVSGLEIVEAMQSVPTGSGDRPKDDVVIQSVTVTESD